MIENFKHYYKDFIVNKKTYLKEIMLLQIKQFRQNLDFILHIDFNWRPPSQSELNIIGVNSLRLEGLQLLFQLHQFQHLI